MKVLLPDNVPLNPTVPDGVTTVSYDVTRPVPDEHLDAEVLVAWANAPSTLEAVAGRMPNLRWVQSLAAGTDAIVSAGFAEDVVITSGAGLHDATVTEHALALTLAQVRRLPQMAAAQKERRWDRDLGGPQPLRPEGAVTSLIGAQVLVWGFGNIGQALAPLLSGLGATVRGVARSAGTRAGFDVIAEEDIESALPQTDVLIMILPATPATTKALGSDRLDLLPNHAYVVNVGRGTTVDEDALLAALESASIAGAAVDVTAVEPLPQQSPLWDAPNLIISPHAAGGRPVGADDLIAENLAAFLEGREMRNVVER
ncbi:phosphoglycerate dehydrogenase [Georgenia deserti]|uniref:Phosphoglycerate dehydrogenase n=1 Tax=Georgenia deserti TaxID=2093781 RepID=A0ABW4L5Z8_9MICO